MRLGYENECRWYGKLMDALNTRSLAVISTALALIFGVLAVGVKLYIVENLEPAVAQAPELPPS